MALWHWPRIRFVCPKSSCGTLFRSRYYFIRPKAPCGTLFWLKIQSKYAYAHAADPVYSLRRNPLRHLKFETPVSRFYKVPIPWTRRHPRDPTPPTPRDPGGSKGPREGGGHGDPRGHWGGGGGPMGPFGVIPKPFRMESHFESKVITNGKTF